MRRILGIAVALTMTVGVASASAHHNGNGDRGNFGQHNGRHHHHHGFVIAGTNASFNGTKNDDGTYTGDLTLTLKSHRDQSGTVTKTFHLDGTAVRFADSVTDSSGDGTVDFSDVQATDVVLLKVFGGHRFGDHGAQAHRSCDNGSGDNTSNDSTTPTIKKAFVFRPQQTAADPGQSSD